MCIRDRLITEDGFERSFQVNHLAGFLLTRLVQPKLIASGASVIQTSSICLLYTSRCV